MRRSHLFRLPDTIELISREFAKLGGFVCKRRRAVTASHGRRCVSADRINDVFTHTEPQGTSLESMTPSVIWLDFSVRYAERADPCRKPIDRGAGTFGFGGIIRRRVFSRIVKERPVTSAPNKVQKALFDDVFVQRHRATLLRDA
jgi:hypothetical protein